MGVTAELAALDRYAGPRNLIWDPGATSVLEAGGSSVTLTTSGTIYYPSDMWYAQRIGSTGMATVQRIASVTPEGFGFRHRLTMTTANPSPAAGDLLRLGFALEGQDLFQLRLGLPTAKPFLQRLGLKLSVPLVLAVSFRNSAANRSYVTMVSVSAGDVTAGDIVRLALCQAGDVTGAWLTDTGLGLLVSISPCVGTTYQAASLDQWVAGEFYGHASGGNLMATNGATLEVFDIGLWEGKVLPRLVAPDTSEVTRKAMRYSQYGKTTLGVAASATTATVVPQFNVPMRVTPTPLLIAGTGAILEVGTAFRDITAVAGITGSNAAGRFDLTTSGLTTFRPVILEAGAVLYRAKLI